MKKVTFLVVGLLVLFCATSFANPGNELKSLVRYWDKVSFLGSSISIYADNPNAISINGMDNNTNEFDMRKLFGEPSLRIEDGIQLCFWGTNDFVLDFYGKQGMLTHGIAIGTLSDGTNIRHLKTPNGVYVGMPFTDAQKMYGLPENYAMELFFVVSPDHRKYLTIYRHYEPDEDGIYRVDGIEILPDPNPTILKKLKH